ncbi:MAG: FkbM family methyltransferase [Methanocorpusculum sp.]|nr:FkbM family methyltransferase [Methanocorpusculum sp.]
MRAKVPPFAALRYLLTKDDRTENFYRLQYERFFARHCDREAGCLKVGPLNLPRLSHAEFPTREEAYYAMEIGDILYPAVLDSYWYVDEGPYEWAGVAIEPEDVVFDCGANLGIFSLLAAYRGATVFAFEPIAAAREMLSQTLSLNPDLAQRIEIVPAALSDAEGTAEFTVLDGTLVGSSMVLPQTGRRERAEMTTVDAFCAKRGVEPDFIKADIEGAERKMLAGAKATLSRCAPKLAVCTYHLPDDKKVLRELVLRGNSEYVISEKWKKMYACVK